MKPKYQSQKYNFFKLCNNCGKRFNPTGKYQKYCYDCIKYSNKKKVKLNTNQNI